MQQKNASLEIKVSFGITKIPNETAMKKYVHD